mmetsp:Transcript_104127/g.304027  ORF Transcript_104127/g.304027 Transcript_104127/m.304027 type:complete len:412 (-) Transcript_104127:118-1353(-)
MVLLAGDAASLSRVALEEGLTLDDADCQASELPPRRLLVLPFCCVFQGYACYVTLQHFLKHEMGADESETFTQAAVFMHYGKLAMRVGHDLVLPCFSSWMRVNIAMALMLAGVLVPPILVYGMGCKWMGLAFLHFSMLGISVGIFEGVYLSVISPLGAATKFWAVLGPPLGMGTVNILGLLITSSGVPPVLIYVYVACCLPLGMAIFWRHAPPPAGVVHKPVSFAVALGSAKAWLPKMAPFFVAKLVGSFVMDNTPGWFYVFNDNTGVPFWGPTSAWLMNHDLYFAAVNLSVFFGDTLSRRVPYIVSSNSSRTRMALLTSAILTSCLGFYMESFATAVVTLFAGFVAFWGNGLSYAVSTKFIDSTIPEEYNRAVYSIWCMTGDLGGILGASLIDVVNAFFCPRSYPHECLH